MLCPQPINVLGFDFDLGCFGTAKALRGDITLFVSRRCPRRCPRLRLVCYFGRIPRNDVTKVFLRLVCVGARPKLLEDLECCGARYQAVALAPLAVGYASPIRRCVAPVRFFGPFGLPLSFVFLLFCPNILLKRIQPY